MLTTEELIYGEYYYMRYDTTNEWVLKFDKIEGKTLMMVDGIITNGRGIYSTLRGWGIASHAKNIRLATLEEKMWLEACREVYKFVPKCEIIPSYTIY